ncbi:MAG: DUF11 domain-containing protein [Epsilonproteobacteria bacterium]|nr:DUF11 domain-containing protein [Campylobacterota bacterium]
MQKIVLGLLLSSVVATSIYAKSSGVVLSSSSFQEKVVMSDSGMESLRLVPVAKIVPGDVVTYKNDIVNKGQKSATDLVIKNPVPEHMEYIEDSSLCKKEQGCTIKFSVDGGLSFKNREELLVKSETGELRVAEAKEITTIRWVLNRLSVGSSNQVEFKARLK